MRLTPSAALLAAFALSAGFAHADTTLSLLADNGAANVAALQALADAYHAAHPDVTIEIEQRPGGADGDNIIKTRLATGEMSDIFNYNSGSLFQAMKPVDTLVDLTDSPGEANVLDSFKTTVTGTDGKIYGVPIGTAMGGGILYNKKIYADLSLSVPKTWAEFMANNEKIKAAGKVPVIQTFGDTWTSQLFVLGDFFNVQTAVPTFAADYTANKAKYATTPAAMAGFQHQEDVFKAGYLNPDFGAAKLDDGLTMLAMGEGAHYPMLTFAVANIKQNNPDKLADVGFFAEPGADAAKNGLTVWMPAGLYIPKSSKNIDEAKKFLDFVATTEACDIQTKTNGATGPYLVKGCTLPADVPAIVSDMMPYFQTDGMTAPALEYLSPVKGPSLEQITVEVGSGIRPAADGAALYDQDVEKQAKQLGLPNW